MKYDYSLHLILAIGIMSNRKLYEYLRGYIIEHEGLVKPVGKPEVKWSDLARSMTTGAIENIKNINIEPDIYLNGLRDKSRSAISDEFKKFYDVVHEELSEELLHSIIKFDYRSIKKLFTITDSKRGKFDDKTLDSFAAYCSYLGWFDFEWDILFNVDKTINQAKGIDRYCELGELDLKSGKEFSKANQTSTSSNREATIIDGSYSSAGQNENAYTANSFENKVLNNQDQIFNYLRDFGSKLDHLINVPIKDEFNVDGSRINSQFKTTIESIVYSDQLSQNLMDGRLKAILLEAEYDWVHHSILASALTFSLFKGWDENKVLCLKELLEINKEPIVSDRAIFGLAIALLIANSEELKKALDVCKSLGDGHNFDVKLGATIALILEKSRHLEAEVEQSKLQNIILFHSIYELFEPPNANCSFFRIKKEHQNRGLFQDSFFKELNRTSIFSARQKILILVNSNRFEEEEHTAYLKLMKAVDSRIERLREGGVSLLDSISAHRTLEDFIWMVASCHDMSFFKSFSKLSQVKDIERLREIFHVFPDINYAEVLPYDVVIELIDLSNRYNIDRLIAIQRKQVNLKALKDLLERAIQFNKVAKVDQKNKKERSRTIAVLYFRLHQLHSERKERKEALESSVLYYKKSLTPGITEISILKRIAYCHQKLAELIIEGDKRRHALTSTIAEYKEAFNGVPDLETIKNIAYCYFLIGVSSDFNKTRKSFFWRARNWYKHALIKEPDNAELLRSIGNCLDQIAKCQDSVDKKSEIAQQAAVQYDEALNIGGYHPETILCLSDCLLTVAQSSDNHVMVLLISEKIVEYCQKCLKDANREYVSLAAIKIGLILMRAGEVLPDEKSRKECFLQAIANFNLVQVSEISYDPVLSAIGSCHFNLRDYEKAREVYSECVARNDTILDYMNFGHCELALGAIENAKEIYKSCLDEFACSESFFGMLESTFSFLTQGQKIPQSFEILERELRGYCDSRKKT